MNTNDIDIIILAKEFDELTKEDKLLLEDIAASETVFNDTKIMLLAVQEQIINTNEIEPKESTKEMLIAEFKRVRPAQSDRSMGLGFLFPKTKPFHQKLGVQLLAIAAILVLIVTVFLNIDNSIKGNKKVAQNTEEVKAPKIQPEKGGDKQDNNLEDKIQMEIENKSLEEETPTSTTEYNLGIKDNFGNLASETASKSNAPLPPPPPAPPKDENEKFNISANQNTNTSLADVSENAATEGAAIEPILNAQEEQQNFAANENDADNFMNDAEFDIEISEAEDRTLEDDGISLENTSKTTTSKKKEKQDNSPTILTSKSLADNEELIKMFYTAM